ncbi:MAG TPA: NADH-quinone oxidoreductase subunit L [Lacibacter sp.]|mgnify:CR=1 FL=1|nr:NADH-quinone oxidoreductase subunit L [Lacibacter sp.]HMO87839.1 NADH-quinone oxidoreductase subunit L [Lacibacter sp.]
MNYASYIAWIPLLPLAGFAVLGLFGRRYLKESSGWIGTALLLVTTVLSLYTAWQYFIVDGRTGGAYVPVTALRHTWLVFSDRLSIDMGILLDPISVMMLVVVSVVSLMVHVFSLGYMKGEERFATYYAFLGLFTFSMLGLVLSSNLFQIYIFWELVGVSSFLLIGYYFDKPSAVAASKKAFIVTRFADLGFLAGILILGFYGESLDFQTLIANLTAKQSAQHLAVVTASFAGITALTWGVTLVFIGGAGKSALFPLHIWLPDAMEGPTPVSALIHAATMVVAGVFLVARMFPLFAMSQPALDLVTLVGAVSAVLAAVIACTQTDIKRVLAYSTMSQIGFMMLALGLTGARGAYELGYTASLFHLFTHAFFKSLLFLGAGTIIHFVHSNELKDMGGLRKGLPVTHITFLVACLAIAGIWPLAGFFSKEEILLTAWQSNRLLYGVALLTSGLTAFYMFRLYFSIFWAKEASVHHSHGEGPLSMKLPLLVLALLTIGAGFLPFGSYVSLDGRPLHAHMDLAFAAAPLALALGGILLALWLYKTENDKPKQLATSLGTLYHTACRKFYIDEIYLFVTKKILFQLVGRPAAWVDKHVVDGLMNGIAYGTAAVSGVIKGLQSGKIQQYTLYFFGGVLVLAVVFLYWWQA